MQHTTQTIHTTSLTRDTTKSRQFWQQARIHSDIESERCVLRCGHSDMTAESGTPYGFHTGKISCTHHRTKRDQEAKQHSQKPALTLTLLRMSAKNHPGARGARSLLSKARFNPSSLTQMHRRSSGLQGAAARGTKADGRLTMGGRLCSPRSAPYPRCDRRAQ
jgi:hypothetical protein